MWNVNYVENISEQNFTDIPLLAQNIVCVYRAWFNELLLLGTVPKLTELYAPFI